MEKKEILVYLTDLTHTEITISNDSMPLNIGMIASYILHKRDNVRFKLFKYPDALKAALDEEMPDIIGFSNYPWNHELDISFARYVKEQSPDTVTVMGGPYISYDQNDQQAFMQRYQGVIDFYCMFEGETSFLSLLENLETRDFDLGKMRNESLPGILSLGHDGILLPLVSIPRSRNIDDYPSPYLSGLMDEFFDGKLSPMIETHRGCPFSCTFCHEGHDFYRKISRFENDRVVADLQYIAQRVGPDVKNLIIADPNFGQFKSDLEYARVLNDLSKEYGFPKTVFASTAKNSQSNLINISRELTEAVMPIWMSVQSLDETVLEKIKRKNISVDSMLEVQNALRTSPQGSLSEVIMCLPGETLDTHINAIVTLMKLGMDKIATYQLMLLDGSQMKEEYDNEDSAGVERRFRVLPRSFTHMEDVGKSVEVEEIVVATDLFSFDDYLTGRCWHLMTAALYSGNQFRGYFDLLRSFDVDIRAFMEALLENFQDHPHLAPWLDRFKAETRDELFPTYQSVQDHFLQDEAFAQLRSGEAGSNLLQNYTAMAFLNHADSLNEIMHQTLAGVSAGRIPPAVVDSLFTYYGAKLHNFMKPDWRNSDLTCSLLYDFDAWIGSGEPIGNFDQGGPKDYLFHTTEEQVAFVDSYLNRYGTNSQALAKALTRMWIPQAYKKCRMAAEDGQLVSG